MSSSDVTKEGMRGQRPGREAVTGAADVVGDLWTVPAYLRRCAPWLSERTREVGRKRGSPITQAVPSAWACACCRP